MKNRCDPDPAVGFKEKLAGLGEFSIRKTYYPELQQRLEELERLKTFLDRSNDAIFLIDVPSGHITDVNESATRQMGWCREEFLESSLFDLSELGKSSNVQELMELPVQAACYYARAVTDLFRKDGGKFPADLTLNRMEFHGCSYVLVVARDITERARAEAELLQAKEYTENLIQGANVIVVGLDTAGCVTLLNRTAEQITGYTLAELSGKNWFETVCPRDRLESYAEFHWLKDQEAPDTFENNIITKDGQSRTISWRNNLISYGGEISGTVSFGIDITEQKKVEEQVRQREQDLRELTLFQRTILDNAAYCIISTTPDGTISSFNRAAERLLGYSAAEVVGIETPMLWHDPDEVVQRAHQLSCELGETTDPGFEVFAARARRNLPDENEWTFIRKDGTRLPMLLSVTALQDPGGDITGFVGIANDLTERKRAEAELRDSEKRFRQLNETLEQRIEQAVDELQQKNRMLAVQSRLAVMGEMISNIAHQWRQPLNTLGLLAQELRMSCRAGKFSQELLETNVTKTMEIIKHMSKTIDDFRFFFRPSKEKEEFRAREILERTLTLLEAGMAEQKITIRIEATGDPIINGYPNEFSQVLLNIISNARDAFASRNTPDPLVTIRLGSECGRTVLTVTDNAGGIPEQILDKVFDPYFSTKGPEHGTGIGLYMCKSIIEKNMKGAISVRNVGDGAEFRIEV